MRTIDCFVSTVVGTPCTSGAGEPPQGPDAPQVSEAEADELFDFVDAHHVIGPAAKLDGRECWTHATAPNVDALVTVVIRTTGRAELANALESVAAQVYRSIEVVLVDVEGEAKLDVGATCGRFPLRIVSHGERLGRGAACNAGLDYALGDFVVFLDDDDWYLPDHIDTLVTSLAAAEDAKAAYAGIECRRQNDDGSWETLRVFNEPYDATRLLLENYLPIHAVLFERSLLGERLRFDESFRVYEDWDFWIQLSQLTRLVHVDRVTAIYRISKTSGFGVRQDDPEAGPGYAALLEKWRLRWTPEQLVAIGRYPWYWAEKISADARRHIEAHEDRVETLKQRLAQLEAEAKTTLVTSGGTKLDAQLPPSSTGVHEFRATDNKQVDLAARLNSIQSSAVWQVVSRLYRFEARYPAAVRAAVAFPKLAWWFLSLQLPKKLLERADARRILASGLFDEHWYVLNYPDVLVDGYRPIVHWMARGRWEGRNPNPLFYTAWYSDKYPEISAAGRDPLLHYVVEGARTGYDPNPLFNSSWYLQRYPDVAAQSVNPLAHYLRWGWAEGRDPHPGFCTRRYLEQNPELVRDGTNPLAHYLRSLSTSALSMRSPHQL